MAAGVLRAGLLCLSCLATACAGPDTAETEQDLSTRVFTTAYQDIGTIYLRQTEPADLALAGLGNLETIDPRIMIAKLDDRIALSVDGAPFGVFAAPESTDAEAWGAATADVVHAASTASVALQDAGIEQVRDTVLHGMFGQLDEASQYAPADDREDAEPEDAVGDGSVGIVVKPDAAGARVAFVVDDTPARAGGLLRGDIVRRIDGWPIDGLTRRELFRVLAGAPGSTVQITVRRGGEADVRTLALERRKIEWETVNYLPLAKAAYFQVWRFTSKTAETFVRKFAAAKRDLGDDLAGLVLDLRGNRGGRLRAGVAFADLFLRDGLIAETHGRHPDSFQTFQADQAALADGLPLVLLVNGLSGGAAELVAAALQDAGRAVVIGSATEGNGWVQTVLWLPNNGRIRLTWTEFRAPSGYTWAARGVLPNLCTAGIDGNADIGLEALRRGLVTIPEPVRQRRVLSTNGDEIEALLNRCPPREVEYDIDLQVALELLNDIALYAWALHGAER